MIYKARYKSPIHYQGQRFYQYIFEHISSDIHFENINSDSYHVLKTNSIIENLELYNVYNIEVRFPKKKEHNMYVVDRLLNEDMTQDLKRDLINIVTISEEEMMRLLLGD